MEEEILLVTRLNKRNDSWIVEINDEVSKIRSISETKPPINYEKERKSSIYRRPVNFQEKEDTSLYTPHIVSFGPYHHDNISCKQANEHKKGVLIQFLKGSNTELSDYLRALTDEVVQDLKDAYNELDPRWQQDDNAFLQLMIYDGCCLLEILHEAESLKKTDQLGHLSHQILTMYRISKDELMEYYRHDMLLLENQLPMQLLVKLVSIQKDLHISAAMKELQLRILRFVSPTSTSNIREDWLWECRHVLHLYCLSLKFTEERSSILLMYMVDGVALLLDLRGAVGRMCTISRLPIMVIAMPIGFIIGIVTLIIILIILGIILFPLKALRYLFGTKPARNICFIIPSATELVKVGIGIKTTGAENPHNISFESGTVRLPEIYVDVATKSRFLNIIAFEKLCMYAGKDVTTYVYFMSRLIQVGDDVRLLQLRGIIHTLLHNDQVVELFKSLTKDIVHALWQQQPENTVSSLYHDVGKSLTKSFYSKMNNPWQQDLWQTYLKSPWAAISIIAAFFLFALTAVQTVYTLLS